VKGQDTSRDGRDGNQERIAPHYMGWGGGGFAGAVAPVFEEVKAMDAVTVAPERMTLNGPHMSYPRHVKEADITVLAENERLRRDWDKLWLERQALRREIEKLRGEKLDLQESALIWIGLYERALEREQATRPDGSYLTPAAEA
jgi:hypothetical protein